MEALIRLAREDEEIDRIARFAMENRSVQGVVLDIDAYWLAGWNYNRRFGVGGFDRVRERFKGSIYDEQFFANLPENDFPVLPMHREALEDWPPDWVPYAKEHGFSPEMSPVRVTICLRPGAIEVPRLESARYRILLRDSAGCYFVWEFEEVSQASFRGLEHWCRHEILWDDGRD